MSRTCLRWLLAVWAMSFAGTAAEPAVDLAQRDRLVPDRTFDKVSCFDANHMLVLISNLGSIAYDEEEQYCRTDGWYYPSSGDSQVPGDKTVVFAAGLWLAGKVNGETRIAVAEFSSEFVPGPILGGQPQPDDPSYHVYKIDQSSAPGDPDYDEWPSELGAPVDALGKPRLFGDQTLWAVFNDADPSAHTNMGSSPLGIEVRQTVWGAADEGEEVVLHITYVLHNESGNDIESCYVSFWSDPDLGDPADDLCGCDTLSDIFYCYNDGLDDIYGMSVPAWGGKVVYGPLVPSPGDVAYFDGKPVPDYRNLPMTACLTYINGTDPHTADEAYNYLRGLDLSGDSIQDPWGVRTGFMYAGDPVTSTGWLDEDSADRRLHASMGPFFFAAGDSQFVELKLALDAGANPIHAVAKLKNTLIFQAGDIVFDPVTAASSDSVVVEVMDLGRAAGWYWNSDDALWAYGVNWAGSVFNGSVDNGVYFFGSSLTDPQQFHDVEIRFSSGAATQKGYRYVRGDMPNYAYGGYHEVPFTVWDIVDNRQLNVGFVEDLGSACFDYTWGPCDEGLGGREYLFILHSDYSESENPIYTQPLFDIIDAGNWDNSYVWWARLAAGHDLSELADGQTLGFYAQKVNQNGPTSSVVVGAAMVSGSASQRLTLNYFSSGIDILDFSIVDEDNFSLHNRCHPVSPDQSVIATIEYFPPEPGCIQTVLDVTDRISQETVAEVIIKGMAPTGICGDADCNNVVNISDAVCLVAYVFGGGPTPWPYEAGDVDCSEIVNISDVVYLVAYIFGGGPDPCANCP